MVDTTQDPAAPGGDIQMNRVENQVIPEGARRYMSTPEGIAEYTTLLSGARGELGPEAQRESYARGVAEGIFDSRLSPAAAAWAVDIAEGAKAVGEAPPSVRRELEQLHALNSTMSGANVDYDPGPQAQRTPK